MKKVLITILLFLLVLLLTCSCSKRASCPTYDGAFRAKKQLRIEKKGDELGVCAYKKPITKKEIKRANKIWNSDFCRTKKKKSKF
jgi:major membrane immunogen (membrane-anchored lipoprotein)